MVVQQNQDQQQPPAADQQNPGETPAEKPAQPADSGTGKNDIFVVRGGKTVVDDPSGYPEKTQYYDVLSIIVDQWMKANPGKMRRAEVEQWIIENNHLKTIDGKHCETKEDIDVVVLHPGQKLKIPEGNELNPFEPYFECPPEKRKVIPPAPAMPPIAPSPPAPIRNQVVQENLVEYNRHSTHAAGGRNVGRESAHGAYELAAQVGINSYQWYALTDNAARIPPFFAKDGGQTRGYMLIQGERVFLENSESHKDDKDAIANRSSTGSQRPFISGYIDQRVVEVNGEKRLEVIAYSKDGKPPISEVKTFEEVYRKPAAMAQAEYEQIIAQKKTLNQVGDVMRFEGGITETAHGGRYFDGSDIRFEYVTVGYLNTPPSTQTPFDAQQYGGLTQSFVVLSHEDFFSFDTVTGDTQSRISDALETHDRVGANTYYFNANRELQSALKALETVPFEQKQAEATRALVAFRDMRGNALVERVDAYDIPMQRREEAMLRHFGQLGLDVDKIRLDAAEAPRLPLQYLDYNTYKSLQDIRDFGDIDPQTGLSRNPQYAHLKPGPKENPTQAGPAIGVDAGFRDTAYRTMNYVEREIANVRTTLYKREEIVDRAQALGSKWAGSYDALYHIGQAAGTNYEVATEIGEGLVDIVNNPARYGYTKESALKLASDMVGGDKAALAQITALGTTQYIGYDQPHNMTNPRIVGAAIQRTVNNGSENLAEGNIDPMFRYVFAINSDAVGGKPDGNNALLGLVRAMGAASPQSGTIGDMPTEMQNVLKAANGENYVGHDTDAQTMVDVATYANSKAAGVNWLAVQRVDALYASAQRGALLAQGEPRRVAMDKNLIDLQNELETTPVPRGGSGTWTVLNTGGINGQPAFDYANAGDLGGLFQELALSPAALASQSNGLLVKGLLAKPAVAQDAMVIALLSNPESISAGIARVKSMATTIDPDTGIPFVNANEYRTMLNALESAQREAREYQRTGKNRDAADAARELGKIWVRIEDNANNNVGALSMNAWNHFVGGMSESITGSNAVMTAISNDAALRNATIAAVPEMLTLLDGARLTNVGGSDLGHGLRQVPDNTRGDATYHTRFYDVGQKGWGDSPKVNASLIQRVLAGEYRADGEATTQSVAQQRSAQETEDMVNAAGTQQVDLYTRAHAELVAALNAAKITVPYNSKTNYSNEAVAAAMLNAGYSLPGTASSGQQFAVTGLAPKLDVGNPDNKLDAIATLGAVFQRFNAAAAQSGTNYLMAPAALASSLSPKDAKLAADNAAIAAAMNAASTLNVGHVIYAPAATADANAGGDDKLAAAVAYTNATYPAGTPLPAGYTSAAQYAAALAAVTNYVETNAATVPNAGLPANTSAMDLAAASLNSGLVKVTNSADGLLAGISTTSLTAAASQTTASSSSAAEHSAQKWWLIIWGFFGDTKTVDGNGDPMVRPDKPATPGDVVFGGGAGGLNPGSNGGDNGGFRDDFAQTITDEKFWWLPLGFLGGTAREFSRGGASEVKENEADRIDAGAAAVILPSNDKDEKEPTAPPAGSLPPVVATTGRN